MFVAQLRACLAAGSICCMLEKNHGGPASEKRLGSPYMVFKKLQMHPHSPHKTISSFNAFAQHQNLDKESIPWGQINDRGSWESSVMTARDNL